MGCIHKTVLGIFSWLLLESPHNPVGSEKLVRPDSGLHW